MIGTHFTRISARSPLVFEHEFTELWSISFCFSFYHRLYVLNSFVRYLAGIRIFWSNLVQDTKSGRKLEQNDDKFVSTNTNGNPNDVRRRSCKSGKQQLPLSSRRFDKNNDRRLCITDPGLRIRDCFKSVFYSNSEALYTII